MAMPSGVNMLMADKMQFVNGGGGGSNVGGGGGEIHYNASAPPRQWFPDERDGFISWLRGEFAASNAIIDILLDHLKSIGGEPGEYNSVFGSINQRRCNWNHVLCMQQYFPVTEIMFAVQQVTMRKQQRSFGGGQMKVSDKKFSPQNGGGFRQGQYKVYENVKENQNSESRKGYRNEAQFVNNDSEDLKTKVDNFESSEEGTVDGLQEAKEGTKSGVSKPEAENDESISTSADKIQKHEEKHNVIPVFSRYVATEVFDGKEVNVVEGLKLFGELFSSSEIAKVTSVTNELRLAGRRGHFQGQTYVVSKRPIKGHGREMIQLGLPVADSPLDDEIASAKDRKIEPIPDVLQDVIERLVQAQVLNVKPDSCMIDYFNEGDHSQAHMCPPWFGRPVCILFLTECDVTFGRVIATEHPGDYRGSLKLSLSAGSLLSLEGKSADFAKHALPSIRKQRILVTFTKFQPKKTIVIPSSMPPSPSALPWGPPTLRPPNQFRHPLGRKSFIPISATGVLPAPSIHPPHLTPPSNIQLFVAASVAPAVPYHAPVPVPPPASVGWTAVVPAGHPPPPRFPLPGTGVFLPPPGSSGSSQPATPYQLGLDSETSSVNENDVEGLNCTNADVASLKCKVDAKVQKQESNGCKVNAKVKKQESNGGVTGAGNESIERQV
ncbi:hypothetical protein MKW94_005967 [Papaver nudicaule]|uniref:Hydroxyproline-rich glycoprotein family protein n=1 Tax=Papaver nudicaule TaxID=74823 RepID=A0AA41VNF4_PAPNU|nr:hypothetical protein [Papaver nudicaule]